MVPMQRILRLWLPLAACLLTAVVVCGQQAKPFLVVAGDTVSAEEFAYAYRKNSRYGVHAHRLTVGEFLQSYIDFRLKVADAKARGLDTSLALRREYENFARYKLAGYLLDSAEQEAVLRAAYGRMLREVDASHILLKIPDDGDTLAVYQQALALRDEVLRGANFDSLAVRYSQDPSVRDNKGHLGYFSAFTMVVPFELAAYNTRLGDVSLPVRTQYGYHLIRVVGIRPARGRMQVAHIMRVLPAGADSVRIFREVALLDSLKMLIDSGADFGQLALQYSQDPSVGKTRGILPWIVAGPFPSSITDAAFGLRADGAVSHAVRSPFGLHLLQRIAHRPVGAYEEIQQDIREQLARVGMPVEGEEALREGATKLLRVVYNEQTISNIFSYIQEHGATPLPDSLRLLCIASMDGVCLPAAACVDRLNAHWQDFGTLEPHRYADVVDSVLGQAIWQTALRRIRAEHRELDFMLREFRDGLLLFEVSERQVWQGAVPTERELERLYKQHKDEFRYPHCVTVDAYRSVNVHNLTEAMQRLEKGEAPQADSLVRVERMRCSADAPLLQGASLAGRESVDAGVANPLGVKWHGLMSDVMPDTEGFVFYHVVAQRENEPKTFQEAQGELRSLYQAEVERQWLKKLRRQYRVQVDKGALRRLAKRLEAAE